MAISVLNTDAGLSGKTIVNSEDAQTVTGLKTFDRDPNAPFAVASGSAVVTNLDADKLDGEEGTAYHAAANLTGDIAAARLASIFVWTSYVPTWTAASVNPVLGDGTLSGKYLQIGKAVWYDVHLLMGSTTTFGTGIYSFALPVTAADTNGQAGVGAMLDSGTAHWLAVAVPATTGTVNLLTENSVNQVGPTVPFTFANGDIIRITGFYRAA